MRSWHRRLAAAPTVTWLLAAVVVVAGAGCLDAIRTTYTIEIRNTQGTSVAGEVALLSEAGDLLAKRQFALKANATENLGELTREQGSYTLRVALSDGRAAESPIFVQRSYSDMSVIIRADGISIVQAMA